MCQGSDCGGGKCDGAGGNGQVMKPTWEKALECASSPLHGTLSRKLRKGVSLQLNQGPVYDEAVFFLGEEFVRVTLPGKDGRSTDTYYDWAKIASIRTFSGEAV